MQENIIGYLLGALDDHEMAEFEAELDRNEDLQILVQDAARSLQVLGHDQDDEQPPVGLVEATCRQVLPVVARRPAQHRSKARNNSRELAYDHDSWSLFDVIVAASVMFVGCLLFFPAISSSRMHSQIAGCQDNLRHIGRALIEYSLSNPTETFPRIPHSQQTGIAGIYAPVLREAGLITEDHRFHCPSSARFDLNVADTDLEIPRMADFAAAQGPELRKLQEQAGGDYGYILGYLQNGKLQAVKNDNRRNYALVTDQPFCEAPPMHQHITHRNVLFEFGGVRVFPLNLQEWNGDKFYENADGRVQAGVDKNDSVIGASATRPLPF